MQKTFGYLNAQNIVDTIIRGEIVPPGGVECSEYDLGKKWDGSKFVDAPKRYKVWSKTAFVTICGQSVFDAIMDGNDKELRYYKYILDGSDVVDLNIPAYFGMVQSLNTKKINNVKILSDAIFQQLTAQE